MNSQREINESVCIQQRILCRAYERIVYIKVSFLLGCWSEHVVPESFCQKLMCQQ